MITIIERSRLPAPPERVWEWFCGIEDHYRDWHPSHIAWKTITGSPVAAGSVVFFDEWIGRFRLAMRCRITEARPGRYFRYEGLFPFSLARAGGWFAIDPADGGCELVAETHVGWAVPLLGPALDRLIVVVFPVADLRRHMVEEGENLARLLRQARHHAGS